MKAQEKAKLLRTLRSREEELKKELSKRPENLNPIPDTLDQAVEIGTQETEARLRERSSYELNLVIRAIDRVEGGSYGICQNCEEEISAPRRKAVPWAEFCISCQTKQDNALQASPDMLPVFA